MTRSGLEGLGRTLTKDDEVVVEATGNAMAVVRALEVHAARMVVANLLQVKAIAHARVKTDKIEAGVLASLRAAGFLLDIWLPDAATERLRRQVARGNQVVRHRTRIKNEVHAILHAHLGSTLSARYVRAVGPCLARPTRTPGRRTRRYCKASARVRLPWGGSGQPRSGHRAGGDRRSRGQASVDYHRHEPDRRGRPGGGYWRHPPLLLPEKVVSYVGLNSRVRQSGLGFAQHGRISKQGRSHARAMLVEAA